MGELVLMIDKIDGNTFLLNRGDLPSGLYFLKVQADELYVLKVLIE